MKKYLEKPEAVFLRVPQIEDICIEFGIDKTNAKVITYMYEVFKRTTGMEKQCWDEEAYDEGYKEGYNKAIEEVECEIESLAWEVGRMKKN